MWVSNMKTLMYYILLNLFAVSFADQPVVYVRQQDQAHFLKYFDDAVLLSNYETQINIAYCGIASAVMILNALDVKPVLDVAHFPYQRFTQNNLFYQPGVLEIVTPQQVASQGMSLSQLAKVLSLYLKTDVQSVSQTSQAQLKSQLVRSINQPHTYVIANFDRAILKQPGSGHFSPIAAYDAAEDRFLILDVARYQYVPYWVSSKILYQAMQSQDRDGVSRGYLVVSAKKAQQAP